MKHFEQHRSWIRAARAGLSESDMIVIDPEKPRKHRRRASTNARRDGRPNGKQRTEKTTEAADGVSKDDAKPPYKQTPTEAEAVNAIVAAQKKRSPRLRVVVTGKNAARTEVDHPDSVIGTAALMRALGTTDFDFYSGLLSQLLNASKEREASESGTNFMLSVIKGIDPRDQTEAMLAAQMAAVHMASMTFARRLAHVETIQQQDSASNAFNKLTRTFAAQMSALKEYRSKGEQKMTVQHVHVAGGGQAIVGNVNAPTEGVGARKKSEDQPHAKLTYAPGVEVPRQIEAERATVPLASRERP
jgi:hypothetical protein